MANTKSVTKDSIDSKLNDLEKIMKQFEDGELSIDQGIEAYKKAQKILEEIKKELKEKELEIEEIDQ